MHDRILGDVPPEYGLNIEHAYRPAFKSAAISSASVSG